MRSGAKFKFKHRSNIDTIFTAEIIGDKCKVTWLRNCVNYSRSDAEQNIRDGIWLIYHENIAPPLGVMPRKIWLEKRLDDLGGAIARYLNEKLSVPKEWIEEYNLIVGELNEKTN